ncbi:MAG: hotdog domain-containing protein [Rhizobium sp.]|nr:hotdog domain-containing protein [Rhizobium sp.]
MEIANVGTGTGHCVSLEMILPEHANHYGTLYGNNGLALMGKAAFVAASRHARAPVVMAAAEKVQFRLPVPVGSLLEFKAVITRLGRTSMTVCVEATMENLADGRRRSAMTGDFQMVAVNEHGRPTPIRKEHEVEMSKETQS